MPNNVLNQLKSLRDGVAQELRMDPRYRTRQARAKSIAEITTVLSQAGLLPHSSGASLSERLNGLGPNSDFLNDTTAAQQPAIAPPPASPQAEQAAAPQAPATDSQAPTPQKPGGTPPGFKDGTVTQAQQTVPKTKVSSLLKPAAGIAAALVAGGLAAEFIHEHEKAPENPSKAALKKPGAAEEEDGDVALATRDEEEAPEAEAEAEVEDEAPAEDEAGDDEGETLESAHESDDGADEEPAAEAPHAAEALHAVPDGPVNEEDEDAEAPEPVAAESSESESEAPAHEADAEAEEEAGVEDEPLHAASDAEAPEAHELHEAAPAIAEPAVAHDAETGHHEADHDEAEHHEAQHHEAGPEEAEPEEAEAEAQPADEAPEAEAEPRVVPKGKASGYVPMAAKPNAPQYAPSIAVKFGKLPNKVDLRPLMTPVEDQGDTCSCVANAVAGAYEYWVKKATKKNQNISRLFVYYNARWRDGSQDKDEGSVIQLAMEGLQKFGACSEAVWPFDKRIVLKKPGAEAYQDGAPYRVHDMAQVPLKLESWKQALAEGKPIVFGIALFDSFDECSKRGGVVPMPAPDDLARKKHSGHSMCAVGYSDSEKVFIVRNSWGEDFGDKGYCYMPYDYLLNPKFNDADCWVFVPKVPSQPPRETWQDDTNPVTNGGQGVDFEIQPYRVSDYEHVAVDLFEHVRRPFNMTVLEDYGDYVSKVGKSLFTELEHFDVRSFLETTAILAGVGATAEYISEHLHETHSEQASALSSESLSDSETSVESEESEEEAEEEAEEDAEDAEQDADDDAEADDDSDDDADDSDDEAEEPGDSDDDAASEDDADDDEDADDEDAESDEDDADDEDAAADEGSDESDEDEESDDSDEADDDGDGDDGDDGSDDDAGDDD